MHTHRGILEDDVSAFLSDQRLDVFLHVSICREEHSVAQQQPMVVVFSDVERTRLTANRLTAPSLSPL